MATCFLDNDIVLKLAAPDIFWEAMRTLGLTRQDLRVLPTAKHKFRKDSRLSARYTTLGVQRAIEIVSTCTPFQQPTDNEEYEALTNESGIDAGEALLVAATQIEADFYLLTGDKRFLKALASSNLVDIQRRLGKRVVCLEQLILRLINTCGFENIRDKVVPVRDCDTALKAAFGSGQQSTPENVISTLQAYVEDLRCQINVLLADF